MSGPQKVYVIGPNKRKPRVDVDLPPGRGKSGGGSGSDGTSSSTGESPRQSDRRAGWPLLLLYCTGPFALLATPRGRKSRPWIITAVLSSLLGLVTVWRWKTVVSETVDGSRDAVVLLCVASVAMIGAFAAWTRGVFLIGRQEGARVRRIPDLLKRPAGTGVLGALMPGLGLLIAGRSRQAAVALWMVCLTLVSVMILSQADWLWSFNSRAGALETDRRTLEYLFIGLACCTLLGVVSWVLLALDGMRNSAKGNGHVAAMRSGTAIAVLCAAVIGTGLALEGRTVAARLDGAAASLHGEGLEIVPIVMAEAAMRLDPSQPAYTAHAIELYESAGMTGSALVLRRSLVDRLEPCIGMLEEEGLVTRAPAPGESIPGNDADWTAPADRVLPAELMLAPQSPMPLMP